MKSFEDWVEENNPVPDHATKGFKGSQWKKGATAAYEWLEEQHMYEMDKVAECNDGRYDKLKLENKALYEQLSDMAMLLGVTNQLAKDGRLINHESQHGQMVEEALARYLKVKGDHEYS